MAYVKKITEEAIEKWIKDGVGQGEFENYKPWLLVPNVRTNSWKGRIRGVKIKREHQLLSNNEKKLFYIAEFCPCVIDIREQYPLLPRGKTSLIAEQIGVRHPIDIYTGVKIVLTTDFLFTLKFGERIVHIARTVKPVKELQKERVIEKFEIERRYWKENGVSWGIVTDAEIEKYKVFARNIKNVREHSSIGNAEGLHELSPLDLIKLVERFKKQVVGKKVVNDVIANFTNKEGLNSGVGLAIFKHLIYQREIAIDLMNSNINTLLDIPQQIELIS